MILDDIDEKFEFKKCKEFYSSREQFRVLKNLTKNSHVQEYGNFEVGELPITLFQSSDDCPIYEKDKFEEKEKENIEDKDNDDDIIKKIIELDTDEIFDDNEEEEIDSFFEDLYKNINNDIENMHKKENYIPINYPKLRNSKKNKNKFRKKSMNKIPSKKVKLYYLEIELNYTI